MQILVVDAANVVGSRPDGWWRDRAGAAGRLVDQVRAAGLAFDEVVVVLEGKARAGWPEGSDGRLAVVHAPGAGDDAIVEQVAVAAGRPGSEVTVVTADRGLRERVAAEGGRCVGPGWLRDRLAGADGS